MSTYGLTVGTPDVQSVGPIAFGPQGILFVADNVSATIFAIDVGDDAVTGETRPVDVEGLDSRLASYLGCERQDVVIRDMAVHPASQRVYLSIMRGRGTGAIPLLIKVGPQGELDEVSLVGIPFSQTTINDAPRPDDDRLDTRLDQSDDDHIEVQHLDIHGVHLTLSRDSLRTATVTDMAWAGGLLLVAGASNEEFSSALRRIRFPFDGDAVTNSVEIFHVSHGKYETASPIRTFVPYEGDVSVLASYTCTPLVQLSLGDLPSGAQAKGKTVAELGAMNQPLDMVAYSEGGEEYLLVSNTRHPLIKIACQAIAGQEGLTDPKEPIGVPRQELTHQGVSRMANLNGSHVVMMQRQGEDLHLRSYSTASL